MSTVENVINHLKLRGWGEKYEQLNHRGRVFCKILPCYLLHTRVKNVEKLHLWLYIYPHAYEKNRECKIEMTTSLPGSIHVTIENRVHTQRIERAVWLAVNQIKSLAIFIYTTSEVSK